MLPVVRNGAYVADSKENKVSIKIYESTHALLVGEKEKFKRSEEPDFADLIAPAVEARYPAGNKDRAKLPAKVAFDTENEELHHKLEVILNSGDAGTIKAVVPNIEIFFDRLKPGTKRKAGGKS